MGHLFKSSETSSYDRFNAWLNPTADEMTSLTGFDNSFSGASNIYSFDTIGFRTANISNGVAVRVDSLNVANVPELWHWPAWRLHVAARASNSQNVSNWIAATGTMLQASKTGPRGRFFLCLFRGR